MKVTKLLNKMPKSQIVQIVSLSAIEEEIYYKGKIKDLTIEDGLKIDKLKVDNVCTFIGSNNIIHIFATTK